MKYHTCRVITLSPLLYNQATNKLIIQSWSICMYIHIDCRTSNQSIKVGWSRWRKGDRWRLKGLREKKRRRTHRDEGAESFNSHSSWPGQRGGRRFQAVGPIHVRRSTIIARLSSVFTRAKYSTGDPILPVLRPFLAIRSAVPVTWLLRRSVENILHCIYVMCVCILCEYIFIDSWKHC